jgi:F-type H+-transporting ATPase subunit b
MQRSWLLGLGILVLALFAAPAFAEKKEKDPEESKKKLEQVRTAVQKEGEPKDILDQVQKMLEEPPKESNIFAGFIDTSIWTIVVFLVLLFVLKKYAWKPMLDGLKHREETIHGAMEEARQAKEEASRLRAELQAEKVQARAEAQAERDQARRDAERLGQEIAAKASAEIQAERDRMRREMDTAKDQLVIDVMRQTAQLATMVAAKAVRRQITIEDQNRLLEEALGELRGAAGERQRVVASIQ